MSNYIVFTSNRDLTSNIVYGEVTYSKNPTSGTVYTYTANTTVTTIINNSFKDASSITIITIPASVTSIGNSAFSHCSGLTTITIPTRVTTIGNNAFEYCTSIQTITLPGSLLSIGDGAFKHCSSLISINIPSQVYTISDNLCAYCTNLNSVIIPSRADYIGNNAFLNCSSINTLLLPAILRIIGENAFTGCSGITRINVYASIIDIGYKIFGNNPNAEYLKNLIVTLRIPNRTVPLENIPIYYYIQTNYPIIIINIKYINNTNTSTEIKIEQNTQFDLNTSTTCIAISQLRRYNIATTSPIRFNPISPYPEYTQAQLAMRRKVEILQYNANNQNTKQNGITERQRFSSLVNNRNIAASTNSVMNRKVCDTKLYPVPTSSCNVPGPIEYLYMDPSIPLYHYNNYTRTYNLYNNINIDKWTIFTYTDIATSSSYDKTIISIYIKDGIDKDLTSFSLIEPVLITVSGSNNTITDYDLDFSRNTVSIIVTQLIFQIHSNDINITSITINNPTNADTDNKLSVLYLNTTESGSIPFSASIYIGNLELNGVELNTYKKAIYDINILATVKLDTGSPDYDESAYFTNITYSAIYNTTSRVNTSSNCMAYSNTTNQYISKVEGK